MEYRVFVSAVSIQKSSVIVEADSEDEAELEAVRLIEKGLIDVDWNTVSSGEDVRAEGVDI